ncbi:DUF535 family protein [Acidovorax sp. Root70]|uniref:DUF535 family protein n=1 Tax=Acidovorax sp. Root70 TaxID=1736590 RepID=UPI00138F2EC2|nr:DUF535 family protein [Acidovorax sp. Root70]
MEEVLGAQRAERPGEGLKYGLRMWFSKQSRRRFARQLATLPEWATMFRAEPTLYFIPWRAFLDERWGVGKRLTACGTDLAAAHAVFGPDRCERLRHGERIALCQTNDFAIHLGRNRICCHEGLWALTLVDAQGVALFNLSFGFLANRHVLVASLQGLQKSHEDTQDRIRMLTKRTHGLRPATLLLHVFVMLCQLWGIEHIQGIDPDYQIKQRNRAPGKGFTFDYRALWQEAGGLRQGHGYWDLPRTLPERAAADIPTQKRAMYARRYAQRQQLAEQLARQWAMTGSPPAVY